MRLFGYIASLFFATAVFFSSADEITPVVVCENVSGNVPAEQVCESYSDETAPSLDAEAKSARKAVDYSQLKRLLLAQKISSTAEVELPDDI
jgi:hypothetical protein